MEQLLTHEYKSKKYKKKYNLPPGQSDLNTCKKAMERQEELEKTLVRVQVDKNTTYLVKPEDEERIKQKHANNVREKYLANNFHTLAKK